MGVQGDFKESLETAVSFPLISYAQRLQVCSKWCLLLTSFKGGKQSFKKKKNWDEFQAKRKTATTKDLCFATSTTTILQIDIGRLTKIPI